MSVKLCKKHPGRDAVGQCASCAVPVCAECAVRVAEAPDRVFCSQQHAESYVSYELARSGKKKIGRLGPPSFVMWIIKAIVVLAILLVVLHVLGFGPNFLGLPFHDAF